MKLAVMTDVHGNLPALDAALAVIERVGVDGIVHTGDVIGIGPYPAECLARLAALPNVRFVMGNHDQAYAWGLPDPPPARYDDEDMAHFRWTFAQLSDQARTMMQAWPYVIREKHAGVTAVFVHYALDDSGQDWQPVVTQPNAQMLDRLFGPLGGDVVFYGHHHPSSDLRGKARYINPGSLGCDPAAVARFVILEVMNGRCTAEHHAVRYDDTGLFETFEARQVPDRAKLYQLMYGSRFGA